MASKGPKPATMVTKTAKPAARAQRKAPTSGKAAAAASPAPVAPSRDTAAPQPQSVTPAPKAASPEAAALAETTPIETVTETVRAAASTATPKPFEDIRTMEDTIKKTTAKAQSLFTEFNDRAKTAMEKGSKAFDEFNDFAKGNVEAVVESSKIAAKGFESFGQDAAEYSRKSFETATAAMKQFASVKSPTDLFKLQSEYMRSAFDSLVAETSKNTEAMLKLAGDVAQPLSNRAAVAAEKIKVAA